MIQKIKNKKYYAWACDFTSTSGEGKLGREFLLYFFKKNLITDAKIETPYNHYYFKSGNFHCYKKKNFSKNKFVRKYISPFIGIYKLYVNKFFLNKEIIYVNYLPIWNFLLFLFFPNKIILGPITGSDYYTNINNINNKIRIILFPFFNSISKSLIKRKKKIIFSTNLIDYNCNNAIKNFQLIYFLNRKNSLQKKTKKKIDFLFYYRNHPNKNQNKIFKILKILKKNGHVIKICGDKLNIFDQENIGYLNKKKLNETLSMSKFILASTENPISFFVQDAMLNNVSVVFDQNSKKIASEYFQNYISINLLKIAKNSKSFFLKKNFKKTSFNQDILSTLRKNLIY